MFMYLLSQMLSAWFAFLIPSYRTLKAISHRPVSEPELQRWLMYWTVVGAFVAVEYVAEWFISWLPFYWELKTLFLLFLALPQTQGSSYIFNTFLYPFFVRHEAEIDAKILAMQHNTFAFLQAQFQALLRHAPLRVQQALAPTPTSSADGVSGPWALASALNFWQTSGTTNGSVPAQARPQTTQGRSPSSRPAPSSRRSGEEPHLPNPYMKPAPSFPVPQLS